VTDTVKAIKRIIRMDQQIAENVQVYPSPSTGLIRITCSKPDWLRRCFSRFIIQNECKWGRCWGKPGPTCDNVHDLAPCSICSWILTLMKRLAILPHSGKLLVGRCIYAF